MSKDHVGAERDVAASVSEQQRVELRAQKKTQRTGNGAAQRHDGFIPDQRPETGPTDNEQSVALGPRAAGLNSSSWMTVISRGLSAGGVRCARR